MPNGFDYAYFDSSSTKTTFSMASHGLDCTTNCALGSTLHQLYAAKSSLAHLLYNDEPAGELEGTTGSGVSGGHEKGVLVADTKGGFWLIHSVPVFPDLGPAQFTWSASTIYGQSFLCVSLTPSGVENAAKQLQYSDPYLFDSNVPSSFASSYPNLMAVFKGTRQTGANVGSITSAGGTKFTNFAKDNKWGQDLYDDLVGPTFKLGFQWETWRRSPYLNSLCPSTVKYQTLNVNSISVGSTDFSYSQDHSKWGISLTGNVVCVGGINRMQSQRGRGGSTMCFTDKQLWTALDGAVAGADACGKASPSSVKEPKPVKDSEDDETPKPKPKGGKGKGGKGKGKTGGKGKRKGGSGAQMRGGKRSGGH